MDTGFHHERSSALDRHAISFQSSSIDSKSEMIMMGGFNQMKGSSFTLTGNSCGSLVVDSVLETKHEAGLAVEWSVEEQYKLDEGLPKYADEPGIIGYVKIAATLRNKTVRDVALRCRWMARKRRKHDELNSGKKFKDKKDKLVESSSKPNIPSISKLHVTPFSVSMNNRVRTNGIHVEALRGSIAHLLEQNSQVLGQISTNISALKLQENVDLFSRIKNNITAILNDMRYMPGPPLPILLNENLVNRILPLTSQTIMFGSSSTMHMKQEPRFL